MGSSVKAIAYVLFGLAFSHCPSLAAQSLAPVILNSFPPQMSTAVGVSVRFEIEATGPGPLYYRWIVRSTNIVSTNAWADIVFDKNAVVNAVVYNRYGYTVRQCQVTALNAPKVTIDSAGVAVIEGSPLNIQALDVQSEGSTVRLQWFKDGAELTGETNYFVRRDRAASADGGSYRLSAVNEIAMSKVSDAIEVHVVDTNGPPFIFDPPTELHMLETDTKYIYAKAVGSGVLVDVHLQDGTVTRTGASSPIQIQSQAGEFYFVATNLFGSSTSRVCKVVVHPPEDRVVLSGSPDNIQTNILGHNGVVTLSVGLVQGADVHYQWYYDYWYGGYAIPGANSPSLQITNNDLLEFAGSYELRATNEISSDVRHFDVEPDLLAHEWLMLPVNGWAGQMGDPVTLMATPTYFNSPFQWYRNGQPLSGETNYMLQFTLKSDTLGTYWVVMHDFRRDFVSNPANVILRDTTDATRDLRLIAEIPSQFDPPGTPISHAIPPVFGGIKDNIVTVIIDGSLYRWSGALEKIVDRQTSLAPFKDGHWKVRSCSAEENGVIGFLAESDDALPISAVFERSNSGLKIIAQTGDTIPDRPDISIQSIANMVRANGKIAMEISGTDGGPMWPYGYHAIHVWDGTNVTRWIDSQNATIGLFSIYALAFDGESIAFSGATQNYADHALYKIRPSSVERIIGRWDLIPGFTNQVVEPGSIAIENGNLLFAASVDTGYGWFGLIEYSPAAEQKFRVVAMPGMSTARGLSLSPTQNNFAYAGDGSILFSARAGGFFAPGANTSGIPFGMSGYGVFRERNGVISEELTSWDRVAGREIEPQLAGADGTNYVVSGSMNLGPGFSFYTTLPGLPRPEDTRVQLTQGEAGQFEAIWNNGGRLQSSHDLINWQDLLLSPGVVTNDFSRNAEFLRVYYP